MEQVIMMSELQYVDLIYVGKEYHKTFEDGAKGYKYLFKENKNQQYPKKFWGSETTKGADILQEGGRFKIGYKNKDNPQGEYPIKVAMFFGDVTDSLQDAQKQPNNSTSPDTRGNTRGTVKSVNAEQITQFANFYRDTDQIEMADKTLNDFVGRFVKNFDKDRYALLEEMYNKVVHPNSDNEQKKEFSA